MDADQVTPPERYRRAAFRLLLAARELEAASAAVHAGKWRVAPTAVTDVTEACELLGKVTVPGVDQPKAAPAAKVTAAFAGPAVRGRRGKAGS